MKYKDVAVDSARRMVELREQTEHSWCFPDDSSRPEIKKIYNYIIPDSIYSLASLGRSDGKNYNDPRHANVKPLRGWDKGWYHAGALLTRSMQAISPIDLLNEKGGIEVSNLIPIKNKNLDIKSDSDIHTVFDKYKDEIFILNDKGYQIFCGCDGEKNVKAISEMSNVNEKDSASFLVSLEILGLVQLRKLS